MVHSRGARSLRETRLDGEAGPTTTQLSHQCVDDGGMAMENCERDSARLSMASDRPWSLMSSKEDGL